MERLGNNAAGWVLALLGIGAIVGALAGGDGWWLHWICKPAATCWLLVWLSLAGAGVPAGHRGYRRWVLAGLGLSLAGDVLLMLPYGLFVPGLIAFLLAHLCYIAAFRSGWTARAVVLSGAVSAVVAGANLWGLWPHLPSGMQLPVTAYVVVIAVMAALAGARALSGAPRGRWAAVGAILFVASDSWLAWDRFAGPLPAAIAGVLVTYWAAQWAIAVSAVSAGASSSDTQ